MPRFHRTFISRIGTLALAGLLSACGGGGGSNSSGSNTANLQAWNSSACEQASVYNTATEGFNQFNLRRQQLGLGTLARSTQIDLAAQRHSNYQTANQTITHEETSGQPCFYGLRVLDRMAAAGYQFTQSPYAYGEVISATGSTNGVDAAEALITAIYHRFVIFEPRFTQAGAGAGTASGGYTYFTVDFAANGLGTGLSAGQVVVYPVNNQTSIPRNFYSDYESPDPVPAQNEVGYPVSVHANIDSTITVTTFTIRPHGGSALSTRLLVHSQDPETPTSAAAIVPLTVLTPNTTYDVQFLGTVDGLPVNRSWSFTTASS